MFGAGKALDSALDIYFENKELEYVVDNSSDKWGSTIEHCEKKVPIVSVDALKKLENIHDYLIFVSSLFYAADIVNS
ncbi:hypothetical protein SAMN06296386_103228 [Lachnospiraceae bacterium]|nr:hypothetical protein SAMN06296386_103228 [Lachnospiraceae bacterium]